MLLNMESNGDVEDPTMSVIQILTDKVNSVGLLLLELKAVLHQEAKVTGQFDMVKYWPKVEIFENNVRALDAKKMRSFTSETSLIELVSRKKPYHFYLDELKNVSFTSSKSDLLCEQNNNNAELNISRQSQEHPDESIGKMTSSVNSSTTQRFHDLGDKGADVIDGAKNNRKTSQANEGKCSAVSERNLRKSMHDISLHACSNESEESPWYPKSSLVPRHEATGEMCSSDGELYPETGHVDKLVSYVPIKFHLHYDHAGYHSHSYFIVLSTVLSSFSLTTKSHCSRKSEPSLSVYFFGK